MNHETVAAIGRYEVRVWPDGDVDVYNAGPWEDGVVKCFPQHFWQSDGLLRRVAAAVMLARTLAAEDALLVERHTIRMAAARDLAAELLKDGV